MESLRKELSKVRIPQAFDKIYKEECCISFSTPISPGGLFIDLNSYLAFGKKLVEENFQKTGDSVYLHIQRSRKAVAEERPHKKPTLLAIGGEGNCEARGVEFEDLYTIVVLPSWSELPYPSVELPEKVRMAVECIIAADGAERKQQVDQWQADKRPVSRHAHDLLQLDNGVQVPSSGWTCSRCDKTDNLWLNLSDGSILCGRRNWDGSGGNNHALAHYDETKFPLAVKLGTITADLQAADVYSYDEDDTVEDPLLAQHLAHFGIDFSSLEKTEMTTAERELDQNLNFDWNRIQEKGQQLEPLFGPGYTGLANLGNSCYLASVMQVIFATAAFRRRYYESSSLEEVYRKAPADPTSDLSTQLAKLGHGLLSGSYSEPSQQNDVQDVGMYADNGGGATMSQVQDGISPRMFKALVGAGHPEFSSSRQQDALEFYQHLLELVERSSKNASGPSKKDPSGSFRFLIQERIQCNASQRVKYTQRIDNVLSLGIPLEAATNKEEVAAYEARKAKATADGDNRSEKEEVVRPRVPLAACLATFCGPEEVADFYSSAINGRTTALKTAGLASFPDYLVLHMRKFVVESGSWLPRKLDVFVDVPEEADFSYLRSRGQQSGEELLSDDEEQAASASNQSPQSDMPKADEAIVQQLMDMGFPRARCSKAAAMTANVGAEEAMNWLLVHMDDPDIDKPVGNMATRSSKAVDAAALATLVDSLGVAPALAERALTAMGGDVQKSVEWIFDHPEESETASTPEAAAEQAMPSTIAPEDLSDGAGKYRLLAFISHMGANTQCGHYVCHIRKEGQWVIFNDSKVAVSGEPPKDMAYLYVYERVQVP